MFNLEELLTADLLGKTTEYGLQLLLAVVVLIIGSWIIKRVLRVLAKGLKSAKWKLLCGLFSQT